MKHPPYHLRTNKAVDRLLFANVLREWGKNCKDFTYYSFGGPFLEDLRIMDHFFPDMQLVSLESNAQTRARQEFHRFNSCTQILHMPLDDFLLGYEPEGKAAFWLDFTGLAYPYFVMFQNVLKAVLPGSVVRITLRAEPEIDLSTLNGRVPDETIDQLRQDLEKTFDEEFSRVLPHPSAGAFASLKDFARMVQLMVARAASTALDTGDTRDYLPVQSTYYDDHTQMLSVTGVVCLQDNIADARQELQSVRFVNFDWNEPTLINIPALSVKERLFLERLLPVQPGEDAGEVLYRALTYKIEDSAKMNRERLTHYADCYRDYPNFARVMI